MKSKKSFALLCALIISLVMSSSFAYAAENQYVENTDYQTLLDDCEIHIYSTNGGGIVEFVGGNWPSSVFPQMSGDKTFRAVANEGWEFAGWSHRITFDGTGGLIKGWEKTNHKWIAKTAFNVNGDTIRLERGATVGEVLGKKLRYYAYANFNPTITTSADENGSITPTGAVAYGGDKTITFAPDQHYAVDQVIVDGEVTDVDGDSYTFTNVTKPHSISVTFKEEHALREEVTKTATCTEAGEKVVTCEYCDYNETVAIDPLGHIIEEGERVEPTCTEDGYIAGKCSRPGCDYNGMETLPKLGHDLVPVEAEAPTCTEDGYATEKCTRENCDYGGKTIFPKLGHDMKTVDSKKATCTEAGFDKKECAHAGCGEVNSIEIAKLPHDFGDWTVTIAPQIGVKGEQQRICKFCETVEKAEIPALTPPPFVPIDPIDPIDPVDPTPTPEPEPLPDDEHLQDPDKDVDDVVKPTLPEDEHLDLDDNDKAAKAEKDADKAKDPDQPQTGDEQQMAAWFALLLLALAGLGVTISAKRKED